MKNLFIHSSLLALLFLLKSCSPSNEPVQKAPVNPEPSGQLQWTLNDSTRKDHSEIGFELMKNERIGKLKIDLGREEVRAILGEPVSKTPLENWGADGRYYSTYQYASGVSLNMGSEDSTFNGMRISSITILSSCTLKTSKGIGPGATFEETKKAYLGLINPDESDDSTLVAGSVYGGLIFDLKKGKVNRIFLGAAAE